MREGLKHTSVLLRESVALLNMKTGRIFADGTLGGGGHSELILREGAKRLIAIDKDKEAIERSRLRLRPYEDNITFVHDDFKNIKSILLELGIAEIDGAVLDLGVSSFQLDDVERGFSYINDAPIDMRMNKSQSFSAYDVVNTYNYEELCRVIYEYGEERFASRIANEIIRRRPITATLELAEIIKNAIPASKRREGPHPAKRTFQAIRIEVNEELSGLGQALEDFIDVLSPGGVLAVITFHSLEDRIVKNTFRTAENPCTCPPDFPKCVCGKKSKGRVLTKKPLGPSEEELEQNPRSRSAKLRAFMKEEV